MPFVMLLLLLSVAFAVACVAFLVVGLRDRRQTAGRFAGFSSRPVTEGDDLRRLLAHRLAAGELTPDDYRARIQALMDTDMAAVSADELWTPPSGVPLLADDTLPLLGPAKAGVPASGSASASVPGPVTFGDPMFVTDPARDALPSAADKP